MLATWMAESEEIPSKDSHSILPWSCQPGGLVIYYQVLDQWVLWDTICTALPKHQEMSWVWPRDQLSSELLCFSDEIWNHQIVGGIIILCTDIISLGYDHSKEKVWETGILPVCDRPPTIPFRDLGLKLQRAEWWVSLSYMDPLILPKLNLQFKLPSILPRPPMDQV